jgi:RHS repeat-associated protein
MRLSRLLVLIAVLACASVTAQAHVGPFGSAAETARREFLPDLGAASGVFDRVTAGRVWENYDCASKSASGSCVDAFGNEIRRTGSTDVEHLYRGEAFDPNVGFYYLRARWMDPSVGRFTQQDVYMGRDMEPMTLHKYLYADADPVNGRDPSGYFTLGEISVAQNIQGVMRTVGVQGMRQLTRRAVTAARLYGRGLIEEMKKCARRPSKCDMPIAVLNTGMPIVGTSEHIDEAQGANPGPGLFQGRAPMILHRSKPHSRHWLKTTGVCGPGRTGRGTGKDCDEYPFASTLEGGHKNYRRFRVSVRPVASWESPLQGALLSRFYSKCNIPRTTAPRGPWWSDRSAFVSIAVPTLPSFFICKG